MPWLSWVHPLVLLLATLLADQATAINYSPMAIPLAVKTPYLSSWMQAGITETPSSTISRSWPVNGNDDKITGWAGFARVDGINYSFLGDAADGGTLIGLQGVVQSVQVDPFLHVLFLNSNNHSDNSDTDAIRYHVWKGQPQCHLPQPYRAQRLYANVPPLLLSVCSCVSERRTATQRPDIFRS
jgi:hypothetical protein